MTLHELKSGDKLKLTNGMIVEVVKVGGRKAAEATDFLEPVYRLKYPPHNSNGFKIPECVGTQIWTIEDLNEVTSEVVT